MGSIIHMAVFVKWFPGGVVAACMMGHRVLARLVTALNYASRNSKVNDSKSSGVHTATPPMHQSS
jgi:hypothetical protein